MKRLAILGSTGSIGESALSVVRQFRDEFEVVALSAHSNVEVLSRQIKEFHPEFVCVGDCAAAVALNKKLSRTTKLYVGESGLEKILQDKRIDLVLLAISGSAALSPFLRAVECGKDIALANKEALVMAGPLLMRAAQKNNVRIMPVDSEQSAIWQCLHGHNRELLKQVYLTASGGPFLNASRSVLEKVTIAKVLKHPRWKMGKKISVDSATMMNKGLEVIEALYLFGLGIDQIKVVVHPEAIIHSMVEFIDGVVMAQLSVTDMRIPIQYAMTYPHRLKSALPGVDFPKTGVFHFEKPDVRKFPCLGLAYRAAKEAGTFPAVLNAANEVCVEEFLNGSLKFLAIPRVIEKIMDLHHNKQEPVLDDIIEADMWARREVKALLANKRKKQ